MDKLINNYYDKFVGLPSQKPIVRFNMQNDALSLVILDILYSDLFDGKLTTDKVLEISKVIVPPPDNGIDLFIEYSNGDDFAYDIIQAKNSALDETSIKDCFNKMERAIKDYIKNRLLVSENLREIISNTSFCSSFVDKCTYYVVHSGKTKYSKNFAENEKVMTLEDLAIIKESIKQAKVKSYSLKADSFNNHLAYDDGKAILCNLSGYELANLCLTYDSHNESRNILFGQNLRDSLGQKSKTYNDMKATIDNEPTKFWHYNNGITIIAENVDIKKDSENNETIELKQFSIINGAQTTSALGKYKKDAEIEGNQAKIENLKRTYVLARIMEITDQETAQNISIYNNSQNPITSRDLVSNREEQLYLNKWLLNCEKPNIYVEIRRGTKVPLGKFYKHQITANDELAQLAFASFLCETFNAKDKKKSIFNRDYTNDYLINEHYQKLFNHSNDGMQKNGVIFQQSPIEIDEALFIKHLFNESKKSMKKYYEDMLIEDSKKLNSATKENIDKIQNRINLYQRNIEIIGQCQFYCISLYYKIKDAAPVDDEIRMFDYVKYYEDPNLTYRKDLNKKFGDVFLSKTIEIISKSLSGVSMNTWVRNQKSEKVFFDELENQITISANLVNQYVDFIIEYKSVKIS